MNLYCLNHHLKQKRLSLVRLKTKRHSLPLSKRWDMNKEITTALMNAPVVRLGEFIEENYKQCGELPCYDISGIDINKQFIKSVARISESNLPKYLEVKKGQFASNLMHIGRDVRIPVAYNNANDVKLVSPAYYVFQLKESTTSMVLAEYIQLLFDRYEFDRLAWFYTDSSVRGNLSWERFCDIEIPLPSIEVQRELLATYEGWLKIAEENEALIEPLSQACHAYIVDCKDKYSNVQLGEYIEIEKDKFVFSGMQTGRDICIRIGLYRDSVPALLSPAYTTFIINDTNVLLPEYLFLQFLRSEMDRLGWFYSDSSVRSNLDWDRFCEIEIPLPSIEVQQAIVSLYHCMEEAKAIAADAREQLKLLCPALVQKAYHTTSNIA